MSEEIKKLLPKHKADVEHAQSLVALGFPAVAPVLSELMEWTQDSNWPVFHVIAPFLAGVGTPVIPEVKRILNSSDYEWKFSVLEGIVSRSNAIASAVKEDLVRLASQHTPGGLDELAQTILNRVSG